jgi:ABC-type Fe3+/spermidine/putrescine transport system ATPase subunit
LVYQRFGVAVFLDRCSDGFGMDPMAFARFDDVSITFFKDKGDRPFTAVENFDLTIEEGEFFCLLGPSGCGKTTALNMLAGFDRPTSGQITLRGRKVTAPGRDCRVVFQGDDSLYSWLTAAINRLAKQTLTQLWCMFGSWRTRSSPQTANLAPKRPKTTGEFNEPRPFRRRILHIAYSQQP